LTLLEVLFAAIVLVLATVPAIELMVSSSRGVVKARDRVAACYVAMALIEEQRSRPAVERAEVPETRAHDLPQFASILDAYGAAHPDKVADVENLLGNLRCRSALISTGGRPAVRADLRWDEAGTGRTLELEARLEGP
jgi:hypothetical protein